jgi:hypothetical protein
LTLQSRAVSCPYCGQAAELRRHGFDIALGSAQPPELDLICPLKHRASTRILAPLWTAAGVKLKLAGLLNSDGLELEPS